MAQERHFHSMSLSASRIPMPSVDLKHSRPLVISPDQDALLEFEERHRRVISTCDSPATADNDMPPRTLASLPPPPRAPKGFKSLPSELTALYGIGDPKRTLEKLPTIVSSSVSNPFINPAPTLEELRFTEYGVVTSTQPSAETGQEGKNTMISAFPGQFTSKNDELQHPFDQGVNGRSHVQAQGLQISLLPSSPMFDFLNLSSPTDQKSPSHSFIDLLSPSQMSPISDLDDLDPPTMKSGLPRSSSSKSSATPRPLFDRPLTSHRISSPARGFSSPSLPPTTNFLDMNERADLVRKSRKLAHVFGQTPEPGALLHGMDSQVPPALATPPRLSSLASRRHSLPLSLCSTAMKSANSAVADATKMRSPISFIDLSDEDDSFSAISPPPRTGRHRCSISSISPSEIPSPEVLAEEARRRKREKLAKLHRFLGSRVPASLVGLDDPDSSLPPEMSPPPTGLHSLHQAGVRRRSSSVSDYPPAWADNFDRIKADLGNREKAINVKRAQKMEKVFGVAPPQTLYHTRHVPSPSEPSVVDLSALHQQQNPNKTAYMKNKAKKESRPGSSESSQELLPKHSNALRDPATLWSALITKSGRRSEVYSHYQHSLNSLHDILDRDDKASLAELHQYLNGNDYSPSTSPSSPVFQFSQTRDRRASNASSAKSDRRLSLPNRTSIISIASETSITSPKPDISDFQLRRRRAAKLTNFFGVDYRELVNDVFESIESGLEHERKRGALEADEVEDLLQKLRELRIKRKDIC